MNEFLTPIILSAGASSRMGRPKALLQFDGRPAVEKILATCVEAGLGRAIVVLGADAAAIRAGAKLEGATVVENAAWAKGMTTSLQAGLGALPENAEGVFVWPVDLPLVPASVPREMALRFWIRRQGQAIPIEVPVHGRRGHPVLFDRAYMKEILALAADRAPRDVVERHEDAVEEIDAPEAVVRDLDTPADYEAAR